MRVLHVAVGALALAGSALAFQYKTDKAPTGQAAADTVSKTDVIARQLPSYPLTACPVSGEPLTAMGDPLNLVHEGRLVRFCCKGCVEPFQKDPAATLAKIDAAVIAQQAPAYPLETCPVSGESLTSMGKPLDLVHGTRLVRFCCKGCVKPFKANPAPVMAKVDAALIQAQRESYPMQTCVVSGEGLHDMGEPIDQLYGTRLIRFCCKSCVKLFKKDPATFVAKVDAAAAAAGAKDRTRKPAGEGR